MRNPATSGYGPGNPWNLSCHVRSPTPLRLPCCEEPQSRQGRWRRGRERETGRPRTPRAKPMSEKPSRKRTLQPLLAPCRSILRVPQNTAHNFGARNQKLTLTYSPCESSLQSSLKTTLWWQELHTALALRRPAEEKNGFA